MVIADQSDIITPAQLADDVPVELKQYLVLLTKPLRILVCRGCKTALLPRSLLDHLRKRHDLPADLRGVVRNLAASLPSLDFDDVLKIPVGPATLGVLRCVDAYQCYHCPFIRRDVTDLRKHVNQEHGISAAGAYGGIQAQSWFGGRRTVYWRVINEKKDASGDMLMNICTSEVASMGDSIESTVEASRMTTTDFTPRCVWGFYGKGFGHRQPTSWREAIEKGAENSGGLL